MLGAKAPNYDAYGLFRALHSHNPIQYSHIVGLASHFYSNVLLSLIMPLHQISFFKVLENFPHYYRKVSLLMIGLTVQ